jgi:hypothetical protein
MVVTTWDGHLRIDHLADTGTVALTLLTVEPAIETQLRAGLVAGFVTTDPHGPPAYVAVALQNGRIPDDIAGLLGPRVSTAITDTLAGGRSGEWLQLDLVEVDDLADAWAPYRAVVLAAHDPAPAPRGTLGSWAGELWTCLGLPNWRDALRAVEAPRPQFRGGTASTSGTRDDESDSPAARGTWRSPDELAAAAGVEPEVTWTIRPGANNAVEIDLRVVGSRGTGQPARAVLQAGMDDGSGRWEPFEEDPAGTLCVLLVAVGEPVSVRFRSAIRRPA